MSTDSLTGVLRSDSAEIVSLDGDECAAASKAEVSPTIRRKHQAVAEPTPEGASQVEPTTYFRYKVPLLRVLGVFLIALASPVILILMALVRMTSSGPALYRQNRVGKDGREFALYKLRTMYQDAEKLTGPVWCQRNDSRVTPIGRVLRHLHLDELPQLWNVVRGDMDLIGPRPERPKFVQIFRGNIPNYDKRHKVRPGITGLAQINLPADETIDSVHRKLVLDLEYINTARLGVDLRIFGCTALRMCGLRHGRAVHIFGLERSVPLSDGYLEHSSDVCSVSSDNGHGSFSPRHGHDAPKYASSEKVEKSTESNGPRRASASALRRVAGPRRPK